MKIFCCACNKYINARLTSGKEIYKHRSDLYDLPFWICAVCKNYVGCHYKTKNPTQPLGCIPTKEVMSARKHIHALIDPAWKSGKIKRSALYNEISKNIGWTYHTAKIRNVEEAREIYKIVKIILKSLDA